MAGRFPPAWLDELRSRADIVQIVSAYVPLKKNGRDYWGLCPFHGEKTASFSVSPEKQMYYCFGCKAGGSVINFVMEMEHLTYPEAVTMLADRLHMTVPEMQEDPDYQKKRDLRERLLSANREAARFYHETLFTEAGRPMLEYFRTRGLSDAVIRRFGLGAAPDRKDALTAHLRGMGYTEEELRLAGLTRVYEAEPATQDHPARPRALRDFFRNRAMFPVIDQHDGVLAFGGRSLDGKPPKYLNTTDTPIFNKRLGVYGANLLRKERGLDRVILVEGYMDVVALQQFGVRGVVATLGTALTNEQARLLKRYAPKVYLAYDGDSAGQHAILRGLDILAAEGIPARVLDFPDGLDPDEFIRRDGPKAFAKLPAVSPETYRMTRMEDEYDLSTQEGRLEYAKACAPLLRRLDPVDLEVHLQRLTVKTGFAREVLLEQIGRTAPAPAARPARRPVPREPAADGALRAQESLISILATGQLPKDVIRQEDFDDPVLKSLYEALAQGASPASLIEEAPEGPERARVARLMQRPNAADTNELIRMAQECLQSLRSERITDEISRLRQQVAELTDPEARRQCLARILALTGQTRT